ncbi:MAG: DUF3592 domain-containing protein [Clostridiales bacterium]|jgi:hypothetical protein|nr:DUF3592 domain-containing protein [Clostridiales bacterium]
MEKFDLMILYMFLSIICIFGVYHLCKAVCFIRNSYKLKRYGVASSGTVIGYSFYRKIRVKNVPVNYYKPVVRYTANEQVLESKSDNSRAIKPYDIGETVKLKYLSNNPGYVKIPENFLGAVAVKVVSSVLRAYPKIISEAPEKSGVEAFARIFPVPFRNFRICSKSCTHNFVSACVYIGCVRLVQYGLPIVIIGSFPVQVILIFASKAIIIEDIVAKNMLWLGALATTGLCAILLAINCVI